MTESVEKPCPAQTCMPSRAAATEVSEPLSIAGIALFASMALNLARGDTFIAILNAAVAFAIAAIPVALPWWSRPAQGPGCSQPPKLGWAS